MTTTTTGNPARRAAVRDIGRVWSRLGELSQIGDDQVLSRPANQAPNDAAIRGLYRRRAHLLAVVVTRYPAVRSTDAAESQCPDVIYVHTSRGQLSWHIHSHDLDLLEHVRRVPTDHPLAQWDGHSTAEKSRRLGLLSTDGRLGLDESNPDDCAGTADSRGIQRLRQRGWRKPGRAVIVDRTSRWGNPFTVAAAVAAGDALDEAEGRAVAVVRYRAWLNGSGPAVKPIGQAGRTVDRDWVLAHLPDLVGRDLACTCPVDGLPCHRDELLIRTAAVAQTKRRGLRNWPTCV